MAKKLEYQIGVDSSQGIKGVKDFSRTVQSELKKVESEFDDTATAGDRVATVLSAMAKDLDAELGRAAAAADALSTALGPELAGKADVGQIITDLQRMGLTFEDIVADADKLATSLKELDQVQMKGIDSGVGNVKTRFGELDQSVRGSRSVMANMIGNATQDLGALSGIAGSAGVAIGQMGEYMADAAGEGEKFGTILTNFGKIAAPIAGIAIATQLITTAVNGMKTEQAFNAELVKDFADALKEGESVAQELFDTIRETGELKFEAGAFGGGGLLGLGSQAKDLVGIAADLGIGFEELQKILKDTAAVDRYRDKSLDLATTNADLAVQYRNLADGVEDYQNSIAEAEATQERWTRLLETNPALMDEMITKFLQAEDPIAAFPEQFDKVADAIERVQQGLEPTPDQLKAITFLMRTLGKDQDEIFSLGADAAERQQAALQKVQDAIAGGTDAYKAYKTAQKAAREEQERQITQILETNGALEDLAGTFEQMGVHGDALRNIFALGNAPLDAEGRVRDIELAIDDLSDAAKDLDLSEGLDPDNLKADALLDQLDSLRPQIQQRITEAFEGGGAEAATAMAQDYIAQVAEELGISEVDAAELLGLADIETTIHVAVEQSEVETARRQLEILTGLHGETPYTASIALALDAGTISGADAQAKIQKLLEKYGVTIPVGLKPEVSKEDHDKANRELDQLRNPADKVRVAPIGPQVDPVMAGETKQDLDEVAAPKKQPRKAPIVVEPQGLKAADTAIDGVARDRTADVYVVFHYPDGSTSTVPAGGGGGPGGGPFLAPMALASGPAPATTSSGGGLMLPVTAAGGRTQVVNQYMTFNTAVMGDPFAVTAVVDEAMRRGARLLPKTP